MSRARLDSIGVCMWVCEMVWGRVSALAFFSVEGGNNQSLYSGQRVSDFGRMYMCMLCEVSVMGESFLGQWPNQKLWYNFV